MKYFIPAFVLTICGFCSFGQTQYNQIAATGPVGIGTLAPSSTYNLHLARKATNVFTPLLMLEDSITNGFSQMGFKGTSRTFHVGVGSASATFSLANKFFIWDQNASKDRLVIDASGNVGIGTPTPQTLLDLKELRFAAISSLPAEGAITESKWANYITGSATTAQAIRIGVSNDNYTRAEIFIDNNGRADGTIALKTANANGGAQTQLYISGEGNVSIGTTDAKGYKLAVNGDAIFTKVKVKQVANWPDYVFDDTYTLRSLQEVESFIKTNKHLPDIASANEVENNGLDVGESQAALLKKVEELTLYLIEQNKKIEELTKNLNNQALEIQNLKAKK